MNINMANLIGDEIAVETQDSKDIPEELRDFYIVNRKALKFIGNYSYTKKELKSYIREYRYIANQENLNTKSLIVSISKAVHYLEDNELEPFNLIFATNSIAYNFQTYKQEFVDEFNRLCGENNRDFDSLIDLYIETANFLSDTYMMGFNEVYGEKDEVHFMQDLIDKLNDEDNMFCFMNGSIRTIEGIDHMVELIFGIIDLTIIINNILIEAKPEDLNLKLWTIEGLELQEDEYEDDGLSS